jgi:hypothetical protein
MGLLPCPALPHMSLYLEREEIAVPPVHFESLTIIPCHINYKHLQTKLIINVNS